MSFATQDFLAIFSVAIAAALLVWVTGYFLEQRTPQKLTQNRKTLERLSFLLDETSIIDCSAEARRLLGANDPTLNSVINHFEPLFPQLGKELVNDVGSKRVIAAEGRSDIWLELCPVGNRSQLTVCGTTESALEQIGIIQSKNENAELQTLRDITKNAPYLIWRLDVSGRLVWANEFYLAACDASATTMENTTTLPSQPLFEDLEPHQMVANATVRRSLTMQDNAAPRWYDISAIKIQSGLIYYAINADPIVRAELGQRKFVQTLSQTFAQLSIGLAIFDRRRQLATFNPALLDMTGLPFDFLSGRPSIDAMLDRLRELQMLPEPVNYNSWREQFTVMEQAAKDGTYCENWNLPNSQTFRVTGKPHPDGAFALLFEDISAEISLTRRFRSEIETCQAVLDNLEEAIVVFSNAGNLVLANDPYCALWDTDLTREITNHNLRAELLKWQDRCTPTRIWTNLKELTSQIGLRQHWSETAVLDDGRQITCHACPISGGMTMIKFIVGSARKPRIQNFKQGKPSNAVLTR